MKNKKINSKNEIEISTPLNFAIKEINSVYYDYNFLSINFDTYTTKDNHLEIDYYTFLQFFDKNVIEQMKKALIEVINEK